MKNFKKLIPCLCIFFFLFLSHGFAQKQQQHDSIQQQEKIMYRFKVAGLLSQPDADNIEALLNKLPDVIYAHINMKDGICTVEALSNSNYKVLLYKITTLYNQKGEKFKAELLPPVEKEKLN